MSVNIRRDQLAFSLVEIMVVVAIIGLLAALALPGFVKARKQSQARRVLNDARMLDAAFDQGALEQGLKDGDPLWLHNNCDSPMCACMWGYMKGRAIGDGDVPTDVLGNPYLIGPVGTNQVRIAETTKSALAGVGVDWGKY